MYVCMSRVFDENVDCLSVQKDSIMTTIINSYPHFYLPDIFLIYIHIYIYLIQTHRLPRFRHRQARPQIPRRQRESRNLQIRHRNGPAHVLQTLRHLAHDGPEELPRGLQHQLSVPGKGQRGERQCDAGEWAGVGEGDGGEGESGEALRGDGWRGLGSDRGLWMLSFGGGAVRMRVASPSWTSSRRKSCCHALLCRIMRLSQNSALCCIATPLP